MIDSAREESKEFEEFEQHVKQIVPKPNHNTITLKPSVMPYWFQPESAGGLDLVEENDQQLIKPLEQQQAEQDQASKWYPISHIDTDYEQLPKEEKQKKAKNLIDELTSKNEDYFSGKKLRFDSRASILQCVVDPDRHGGNIAAHLRPKIENLEHSETPKLATTNAYDLKLAQIDENQLLSGKDLSLLHYGTAIRQSKHLLVSANNCSIISFWRPNEAIAKGQ